MTPCLATSQDVGNLTGVTTTLPKAKLPPVVGELAQASVDGRLQLPGRYETPIQVGKTTTFLYVGEADRVKVQHFMSNFPKVPVLEEVAPGFHAVTIELPDQARFEYKLAAKLGDQSMLSPDPFNRHLATDPHGANSVAFGPGYIEPPWVRPRRAPEGKLVRSTIDSQAFGYLCAVNWYHPAAESGGPWPLLVVHDGSDFVRHAGLLDVLDNLIAERVIPPVVVALVDPIDRMPEYSDDPRQAGFVAEIVEEAIAHHGVSADPANHVYVGASLGAVAALSAAWRNGGVGGLVLLSGSFVTALGGPNKRGQQFLPTIDFVQRFENDPRRPAERIYQACGIYEGLAPDNRSFTPLLVSAGAAVIYEEHRDGHHWHNWRNRLARGLSVALGSGDPPPSVTWAHD